MGVCVLCFGEGGKEQERIINMLPLRQKSLFGGWDKFEKKLYRERFGPGVLLGQQPHAAAQTSLTTRYNTLSTF